MRAEMACVRRLVVRHTSVAALAIAATFFSRVDVHAQAGTTESRMAALRQVIAQYVQTRGQLPGTLQEICRDGVPRPLMPASQDLQGLRDGWGRPFVYRQIGGEYELRSLGADGEPETADDLVFRPSWERAWFLAASGCYTTDFARWPEFQGAVLVLDTVSVYPGAYVLEPSPYPYRGLWRAPARDSLVLEWAEVHSIARMWLRREGDALRGLAERPGYRSRKIVATRTICPDGSG